MIPFNVTALTLAIPFIQRKARTRKILHTKRLQNFTQTSFIVSTFNQTSYSVSKMFSSTTAQRHFKRRAMAEMNSQFTIEEDQKMETHRI